ncbi:insulinase family protein [Acholeplasma equirhinis]|uniref:M16 family metallopeptidase n=1 Tax=Acholeplasma equirhinis TaxID=555393 RepID=UPI00197A883B|nr:pitrilysin family protein [Acholeplasma equirhinis]MBN3490379.1 insulinase family protein [Acholeplasma equirhinis]
MTFIQDDTFKTIHVSFYFLEKLKKDTIPYRFLLTRLLTSYTKSYPTKKQLIEAFANLYGMYVSNQVFMLGEYQILRFTFVLPNPKFIDDQNYINDIVSLLKETFFEREMFEPSQFNEVKRFCLEYIQTRKDRKFEYAKEQFMAHTFLNHPYGLPIYGTQDTIKSIDVEDLYNYYKGDFKDNILKIYVSGDISDQFRHALESISIYETQDATLEVNIPNITKPLTNHEEEISMHQAMIFLGFSLPIERKDKLYTASQLASLILGGYPESILFKRIRETLGLAYEVDSHFEYDKKYLFIYAGVNLEQKDYAFDEMIEIINNFQFDGPSEKELSDAKIYLKSQILSSLDQQQSLIPRKFLSDLYQVEQPLEETLSRIDRVTVEDIRQVLQKLELKTTYTLMGDQNEYQDL